MATFLRQNGTAALVDVDDDVLHGWGQFSGAWMMGAPHGAGDADDLAAYEKTVTPHLPAMLSFYVAPVPDQIAALSAGVEAQRKARGPFVAQVALYFFSLQREIVDGARDEDLRVLARALRDSGLPVLLRVGYEFDNPWARYAPTAYVPAYRRVVGAFRGEGATNVAFVWHASTLGLIAGAPDPWYPGDDVVDWFGVTLFHTEELRATALMAFLERARAATRPVLVAECAPIFSSDRPAEVRGARSESEALAWYDTLFALVDRHRVVSAVSLIAVDWRRLARDLPAVGWPDTRLDAWPGVAAHVREEIGKDRYVHRSELQRRLA